jgi:hypothetical protein
MEHELGLEGIGWQLGFKCIGNHSKFFMFLAGNRMTLEVAI